MKRQLAWLLTLAALGTLPLAAQRPQQHGHPRANQGHPPPPPAARPGPGRGPEAERYDGGRMNTVPHVNHDRWYGHDRPDDPRFHQGRVFEHGHFGGGLGPSHRWAVSRFDRVGHRFWLGSSVFLIAPWDWPLAVDWCWDCGDDFVVYDDPDHPGWYLLYNVETGAYLHVRYGG